MSLTDHQLITAQNYKWLPLMFEEYFSYGFRFEEQFYSDVHDSCEIYFSFVQDKDLNIVKKGVYTIFDVAMWAVVYFLVMYAVFYMIVNVFNRVLCCNSSEQQLYEKLYPKVKNEGTGQ